MATATRITLDEFMNLKEDKPALEFACGEVTQKPMPDRSHSRIQFFLAVVLGQFLARTPIGQGFTEFRCIFGSAGRERVFVPDVVYVRNERLGTDRYLRTAPDLAIEILSPDQPMARFLDKIQFYLLNGVQLVWVIDPTSSTIAVLAPGQEGRTLMAGDTLDGGHVLPGFSIPVDDVFAQVPS
jgi:Uma2 family endonuclease